MMDSIPVAYRALHQTSTTPRSSSITKVEGAIEPEIMPVISAVVVPEEAESDALPTNDHPLPTLPPLPPKTTITVKKDHSCENCGIGRAGRSSSSSGGQATDELLCDACGEGPSLFFSLLSVDQTFDTTPHRNRTSFAGCMRVRRRSRPRVQVITRNGLLRPRVLCPVRQRGFFTLSCPLSLQ